MGSDILNVTSVSLAGPYSLLLSFSDGTTNQVCLRDELHGPVFEPLRDAAFFAQVTLDGGTVAYPNGADFAPEFLHELPDERVTPGGRRAARG